MKTKSAYYSLLLIVLVAVLGYFYFSGLVPADVPMDAINDSENLLANPSFESPSYAVADKWESEYTSRGVPAYYVSIKGTTNGSFAQQIDYTGSPSDIAASKDDRKFIEVFQLVTKVRPGDKLRLSMNVSGSLTKTPTVIGMEGFNRSSGYSYLGEADYYIKDLSDKPKYYEVIYTCPKGTDCIAVYLQCQEINPKSVVPVCIDDAKLVRLPSDYTEPVKDDKSERIVCWISLVIMLIPTAVILSEFYVRIKTSRKKYEFSGYKNEDYQILVPIWGNIKYLQNIEYLSPYGSHVVLCTTGQESQEMYDALESLSTKFGLRLFIDKTQLVAGKKRKERKERTTSGQMRDTLIRNALKTVKASYVVTLDADSTTEKDPALLIGELEYRDLDIASIRIVPENKNESFLAKLQVFEYEVAMNFRYLCPWLISGACHTAKTHVLSDIMDRHSLFFQGNDVETGLIADTLGYKIGHIPFIVKTFVPADLISWMRQRLAWAGGEFRLYVVNIKFMSRHPFFWFYGAVITISLFPLRWLALSVRTPSLYIVLVLYAGLILYTHWKNKNFWLIMMPFYTLFNSLVLVPLGVLWYFHMAYKDKNYGIITPEIVKNA